MSWTIDPSTSEGFYWFWNELDEPTIVEVERIGRELFAIEYSGDGGAAQVLLYEGQWSGPLRPPPYPWPHKGSAFERV